MRMVKILAAVAAAFVVGGEGSHAAVLTTSNGTATCYEVGSVTEMAACSGYTGANTVPGILNGSSADVWDIQAVTGSNANSEANEADLLSKVAGLGPALTASDMDKTGGNSGSMTFLFDSLYAVIKIGAGHLVIRNDAGKAIDLKWEAGTSGGLSHQTQAGALAPIPAPAALPLLALGLGGLAYGAWRQRRKPA